MAGIPVSSTVLDALALDEAFAEGVTASQANWQIDFLLQVAVLAAS